MIAPLREAPRAWTVAELLTWTAAHFQKLGYQSARLDAEVLLAQALGCTRLQLYTGYHQVVEPEERTRFRALVGRRSQGEPVAYIIGQREFYSLSFEVSPAVLIPRPETEHLVDAVLEHVLPQGTNGSPRPRDPTGEGGTAEEEAPVPPAEGPPAEGPPADGPRVLDLGTGSGNIAVTLAVRVPRAQVTAVDRSVEALEVARRNARRHGVESMVDLVEGDLFSTLRERDPRPLFHAIASNPPYIAPEEFPGLSREVKDFEPPLALLDLQHGEKGDGLGFHRSIAAEAREFLLSGGLLAMEVGAGQAARAREVLSAAGFLSVTTLSDYAGIERVVRGLAP